MSNNCMGNKYLDPLNEGLYKSIYNFSKHTNISPNIYTGINIILTTLLLILSILFFLGKMPKILYPIIFIGIYIAHIFIDVIDGCVARAQDKFSNTGKMLDQFGDIYYWLVILGVLTTLIIYNRKDKITIITLIIFLIIELISVILFSVRFKSVGLAFEYLGYGYELDKRKLNKGTPKANGFDSFSYLSVIITVVIIISRATACPNLRCK